MFSLCDYNNEQEGSSSRNRSTLKRSAVLFLSRREVITQMSREPACSNDLSAPSYCVYPPEMSQTHVIVLAYFVRSCRTQFKACHPWALSRQRAPPSRTNVVDIRGRSLSLITRYGDDVFVYTVSHFLGLLSFFLIRVDFMLFQSLVRSSEVRTSSPPESCCLWILVYAIFISIAVHRHSPPPAMLFGFDLF